jgi:hypothetical protein
MTNKTNAKTLYERVEEEMLVYDNACQAAADHLKMAESHLFEEFEGRDVLNILSELKRLRIKIETHFAWNIP